MMRILELHLAGEEYVALFDHHDDLVLFVGDEETADVSFYQIKSEAVRSWTPTRLAYRAPKGELPRSVIGKAYYNVSTFGPEIRRAAILSHLPLNATMAADGKPTPHDGEIMLAELSSADLSILTNSIKEDFPGEFEETYTKLLTFERVPVDPESHRDTVVGRITFMLDNVHPDGVACVRPFFDALLSEAGRCTGNKTRCKTVSELKQRKSLSRRDISDLIARVQSRHKSVVEWWPSVQSELTTKGIGALAIERIRSRCLNYWRSRQKGDRDAINLRDAICAAMADCSSTAMDSVDSATVTLAACGLAEPPSELYDLRAAIIVEVMESAT